MNILKWKKGRQGTGYEKMILANIIFPSFLNTKVRGFDIHILFYPEGIELPEHVDLIEDMRHVRINFVLKKSKLGGVFKSDGIIFTSSRLKIFYSDLPHSVSKIEKGNRWLLSIGLFLRK